MYIQSDIKYSLANLTEEEEYFIGLIYTTMYSEICSMHFTLSVCF